MKRRRFANGVVIGFRRREWWIGARYDLQCDHWEIGLLGLTLLVPLELFR